MNSFDIMSSEGFTRTMYSFGFVCLIFACGVVVVAFAYYGRTRDIYGSSSEKQRWTLLTEQRERAPASQREAASNWSAKPSQTSKNCSTSASMAPSPTPQALHPASTSAKAATILSLMTAGVTATHSVSTAIAASRLITAIHRNTPTSKASNSASGSAKTAPTAVAFWPCATRRSCCKSTLKAT